MKRRFSVQITQREVHSWNPFAEDIVQTRNQVGVKVKYPGQKWMGRLSSLSGDRPEQQQQEQGQQRSRGERAQLKVAGKVDKWRDKAIQASGRQYEVKDRDGHPRGYFPSLPPAQAMADEVGGTVYDHLEGRIVYSAAGDDEDGQYDVPDDGTQAWEQDW